MKQTLSLQRLLTRKEAAAFLGVKVITLAIWKSTHRYDLPVIKLGRLVRYHPSDLLEFVERSAKRKENGETST